MDDVSVQTERFSEIMIRADLYRLLRDYCDDNGLRLVDFVEDALENAPYREELARIAYEVEKALATLEEERRKIFRLGFLQGCLAGVLVSQGKLGMNLDETPSYLKPENETSRPVSGKQLGLFD